jgi:hypothetical protein
MISTKSASLALTPSLPVGSVFRKLGGKEEEEEEKQCVSRRREERK